MVGHMSITTQPFYADGALWSVHGYLEAWLTKQSVPMK
jgi:hypothetical protein